MALLNFVLIIVIYYIWIFSLEVVLERKMYQYGLEVNGWDSLGEPSEELRAAMDRWQSDTGRNFGKIFIVPFSFIYSLAFWVVLYLFDGIKKKSLKEVA
ncbi:MAG: hypothetical protein JKY45_12365 [Emcibacter sp.]|nr:hypothetical protein [Emcibacter sp.]